MKANELMIGDWVQNPLGWKAQVQSIRYVNTIKDEWEWLVKIGINNETFQDYLSLNEIEPIPLTPEILEKNGFSNNYGEDDLSYAIDAVGDVIGVHIVAGSWILDEVYTDYVHQLQHALRLCGSDKEITL